MKKALIATGCIVAAITSSIGIYAIVDAIDNRNMMKYLHDM